MRELFESTIERLLADTATSQVVLAAENGAWPAALWATVEESGFALAAAPEAAGGAGASWDDLFVVLRACGRHSAPVPLPEAILANWLLGKAGLEPLSVSLSFSAKPSLTIEHGRVNGRVSDVPWGRHVEHIVAIADGDVPTVIVLPTAAAKRKALQLNIAGEPRDDLDFEGATAFMQAPLPFSLPREAILLGGSLLRSAQTAGALEAVLDLTTRYAIERVQFGKPIGNFQAIQHQIAVLAEHTAMASVAAEAACAQSADTLALLPIAAAKICCAEAAGAAAAIAHAVHGAIGFTHEHALHLSTRRLWAWRSEYGSLTHWSQLIGRTVCAGGSKEFWPTLTRAAFPTEGAPQ